MTYLDLWDLFRAARSEAWSGAWRPLASHVGAVVKIRSRLFFIEYNIITLSINNRYFLLLLTSYQQLGTLHCTYCPVQILSSAIQVENVHEIFFSTHKEDPWATQHGNWKVTHTKGHVSPISHRFHDSLSQPIYAITFASVKFWV